MPPCMPPCYRVYVVYIPSYYRVYGVYMPPWCICGYPNGVSGLSGTQKPLRTVKEAPESL